jgi:hypothetical protein
VAAPTFVRGKEPIVQGASPEATGFGLADVKRYCHLSNHLRFGVVAG